MEFEKYINPNCKIINKLCWQYVYMINNNFNKNDIDNCCRKCTYYKTFKENETNP
jgi:hypothetical protein